MLMESPIILQARNLTKRYGANVIFQDISLDVQKGETIVIIGPSGTGKSTLLRCLNLLTHVDAGQIFLEGQEITAPGTNEDRVRQQIGMVFQNFLPVQSRRRAGKRDARPDEGEETAARRSARKSHARTGARGAG